MKYKSSIDITHSIYKENDSNGKHVILRYQDTGSQDVVLDKWIWMMDYCKKRGVSPAQTWAWKQAEEEYNKTKFK